MVAGIGEETMMQSMNGKEKGAARAERTLAWFSRNRRIARDFERYAQSAAAFISLAMIR